jgi:hypothetical protein
VWDCIVLLVGPAGTDEDEEDPVTKSLTYTNSPLTRAAITTTVLAYNEHLIATRTVREGDKVPSWITINSGTGVYSYTYDSRKAMLEDFDRASRRSAAVASALA